MYSSVLKMQFRRDGVGICGLEGKQAKAKRREQEEATAGDGGEQYQRMN
jgi:hypothetical protein